MLAHLENRSGPALQLPEGGFERIALRRPGGHRPLLPRQDEWRAGIFGSELFIGVKRGLHLRLRHVAGGMYALDLEPELVRVRRPAERFIQRDDVLGVELVERLVEGLHPVLRGSRGDRLAYQLGLLLVLDADPYVTGRAQYLDRRHAAVAVAFRQQPHRDDSLENPRELQPNLLLLVRRKDRDDSVDRLGGIEGVQRRQHEVPGLGRRDGGFDRLVVAHFADENDIGVLAQRRAQSLREGLGVDLHFALVDEAFLVAVKEFDRVLDGHDVFRSRGVDVVDHRGQRGRFARTGGARAQDQAAPLLGNRLEDRRQQEILEGMDLHGNDAKHQPDRAALLEDVATKAAEPGNGIGDVQLVVVLELLLLAAAHDAEGHRDGVLLHQALELHQGKQVAVNSNDGVAADLEMEVGRPTFAGNLEQVINVHVTLLNPAAVTRIRNQNKERAPWGRKALFAGESAAKTGVQSIIRSGSSQRIGPIVVGAALCV